MRANFQAVLPANFQKSPSNSEARFMAAKAYYTGLVAEAMKVEKEAQKAQISLIRESLEQDDE